MVAIRRGSSAPRGVKTSPAMRRRRRQLLDGLGHLGHVDVLEQTVAHQVLVALGVAELPSAPPRRHRRCRSWRRSRCCQARSACWPAAAPARSVSPRGSSRGWQRGSVPRSGLARRRPGRTPNPRRSGGRRRCRRSSHPWGRAPALGRGAGGQRREQHRRASAGSAGPCLLDHQFGQLGRHTGEAVHQTAAGVAFACGVD